MTLNGNGTGSGGSIVITESSSTPFVIGSSLSVNGGNSGYGGSIKVTNNGTGGITLNSGVNLSAQNDGKITLYSFNGPISTSGNTLSADLPVVISPAAPFI